MATGGGVSGYFECPAWQRKTASVPSHRELRERGQAAWIDEQINEWDPDTFVGRGTPDVAALSDPATGYQIYVGARRTIGGGTSAAAPFWAGLVARVNQRLTEIAGRPCTAGFLTPVLYRPQLADAFQSIQVGDNHLSTAKPGAAFFQAARGWDACTGLGAPHADRLLDALRSPI